MLARMGAAPRAGAGRAAGKAATAALAVVALTSAGAARADTSTGMSDMHEMMEWGSEAFVLSEVLEIAPTGDERPLRYDLLGWVGGAYNRIWAKAEGEQSTRSDEGGTELQLLFGRLISPYWDAQVGLRLDLGYGAGNARTRALVALGLQGLAPGWFELEPTLFVSHRGDVSGNLTASYDVLITQRLVAQARGEAEAAAQDVPEFGVGSGFGSLELGVRVRYEIVRRFAPYVGVSWERLFMDTADRARASGLSISEVTLVAGLRLWM
jgi:copper resistance protein B